MKLFTFRSNIIIRHIYIVHNINIQFISTYINIALRSHMAGDAPYSSAMG